MKTAPRRAPPATSTAASLAVATLLPALMGCSSSPSEPVPATPPPDSMRTCSVDDDCAVYEAGCCDHCNGGQVFAVNQASLAQAKRDHVASCPNDLACTLMGCANRVAVCKEQSGGGKLCEHVQDPSFGPPCSALDETTCGSRPDCKAMTYVAPLESCGGVANPKPVFGGCAKDEPRTCTAAETCAVQESSGTKGVFPSGCLPAGWENQPMDTCCS